MRAFLVGTAALAAFALAGCVAQSPAPVAPAPALRPAPPPAPPPVPPPPPPPQDWRDIALTPGDWTYRQQPSGSVAEYGGGAPAFALRCLPATRQVVMERIGAMAGARLLVRTSFGERAVTDGTPLPAGDPVLDQIAFSRGRFTIAAENLPMLVIPAWPEPARTIEDCRG